MRSTLSFPLLLATAWAWTPETRARYDDNENQKRTWVPGNTKIRGVNLGSQFIIEPWMAADEFKSMGCAGLNDEWQCVQKLGQNAADSAFKKHWDTWTTEEDIKEIASLGLNTVRMPVGFWIKEDLVHQGEHYPRGGLAYLNRLVGWCRDHGIYVIMDLHAGPGSQTTNQQFTGHSTLALDPTRRRNTSDPLSLYPVQSVKQAGFFTPANYERAAQFLEWMTEMIHTNPAYKTVGMLEVMNEPIMSRTNPQQAADMIKNFYPLAWKRIRAREQKLAVKQQDRLHIQMMGKVWGSGDPTAFLPSTDFAAFDDHRYYMFDKSIPKTKAAYLGAACKDRRQGGIIVGEWSIAVPGDVSQNAEFGIQNIQNRKDQREWYTKFWAAQVQAFERSAGWVFWSWKCNWIDGHDEWRWCYKSAVAAGVIPRNAASAQSISAC
ncbi:hypothetical protein E4U54_000049 [Claviceps lovelessii]|nr:hypothetical protein E4U54_000049 [Claviceps lovelessii]